MRARWLSSFILLLLLALSLACGEDGGGPDDQPDPSRVSTEPRQAASATVGLFGGTISATASDGTRYTLTIPEGALPRPTQITVTPVRAIEGLPVLEDDVAAGVQFSPAGLVFAVPLTLTIESAAVPAAGEFPIAVNYSGDAASFTVGFAVEQNGDIVVPIQHFSGVGVNFGTEEDMGALFTALPTTPQSVSFADELLLAYYDDPTESALHEAIMRRWFEDAILPNILSSANDGELLAVLSDFDLWRHGVPVVLDLFFDVDATFEAEINLAREAFILKLQAAVTGNNDLCSQNHSLEALQNVLFWQRQAGLLSIDTPSNGLDAATVRSSLCAELVIEGASLPANMQVGFPHSLDFRVLLKFVDGFTLNVACAISITAQNADLDNPTGFTDPFGNYTTVITATNNSAVSLFINGSMIMPGETAPSIIEADFFVSTASGTDLNGSYMGFLLLAGAVLDPVVHTATITQNQNAVSGDFEGANFSGTFTATLSGAELLGVDISVNGSALTVVSAAVFQQSESTTIAFTLSGEATINGSPIAIDGLRISGPDCLWENLSVSGDLVGATLRVRRSGASNDEIVNITGTASLTASSFTATFSGSGFSGTVSGGVAKPGQGTGCTFIGVDNGSISVCGQSKTTDFCIGTSLGSWVPVVGGPNCPNGDDIKEVRLSFGSGAGMGAFCQ